MIRIALLYQDKDLIRVKIRGHAYKGAIRDAVCTGVAVLSRTLLHVHRLQGHDGKLEYGEFDLEVRLPRDAETIVAGFRMLKEISPENVRIRKYRKVLG